MPLNKLLIGDPMLIDLTKGTGPDLQHVGGKAHNLARLFAIGMPVPAAIVIPHLTDVSDKEVRAKILQHKLFEDTNRLYAVRSSGVGEDSEKNSYAGIFDTYLDVPALEVFDKISRVRQSVLSTRSQEYSGQRGVRVASMSVIVQHMIPADYAGVAFTMSPIEKDTRIALIEIVHGVGESLVSGKITPTTIRYNKRTNLYRVQQDGAKPLPGDTIDAILQQLMPLLNQIEHEYGYAVDVEWAYAKEQTFILQARPITT